MEKISPTIAEAIIKAAEIFAAEHKRTTCTAPEALFYAFVFIVAVIIVIICLVKILDR